MTTKRWVVFGVLQLAGIAQIAASKIIYEHNIWAEPTHPLSVLRLALFVAGWACVLSSATPFLIKPRRGSIAAVGVVLLCLEWAGACTVMPHIGAKPEDSLVVADPKAAVYEARALIANYREDAGLHPEDLPQVLRVPHLRYARLHRDHLDLVMSRFVDSESGFRIWAPAGREHKETPTKYQDISFYSYSNDFDESPKNIY